MQQTQIKEIRFSGIKRNTNDLDAADGQCHELINLRFRDNALRPVGDKTSEDITVVAYDNIHKHPATDDNYYIGLNSQSGVIWHFHKNTINFEEETEEEGGEEL